MYFTLHGRNPGSPSRSLLTLPCSCSVPSLPPSLCPGHPPLGRPPTPARRGLLQCCCTPWAPASSCTPTPHSTRQATALRSAPEAPSRVAGTSGSAHTSSGADASGSCKGKGRVGLVLVCLQVPMPAAKSPPGLAGGGSDARTGSGSPAAPAGPPASPTQRPRRGAVARCGRVRGAPRPAGVARRPAGPRGAGVLVLDRGHLMLFYFQGAYYHWAKRVVGVQHIFTSRQELSQPRYTAARTRRAPAPMIGEASVGCHSPGAL